MFIRVSAPALGPVLVATLRVTIAGVALLVYAALIRSVPNLRAKGKQFLILGALNAAIPYALIATAELHLTASLASILNATTPMFTAVIAAVYLRDRLSAKKGIGLVLGLVGVAILVGWSPLPFNGVIVLSVVASLAAALSYGFAGIFAQASFDGIAPLELAIGQQAGAMLLLFPLAVPTVAAAPPTAYPPTGVIVSVVGLALLSTAVAYLLYFYLIVHVGPMKTLSVTYLIPVFGIAWGALFLHESLQASTFIGLAVILASVALVTGTKPRTVRRGVMIAEPSNLGSSQPPSPTP